MRGFYLNWPPPVNRSRHSLVKRPPRDPFLLPRTDSRVPTPDDDGDREGNIWVSTNSRSGIDPGLHLHKLPSQLTKWGFTRWQQVPHGSVWIGTHINRGRIHTRTACEIRQALVQCRPAVPGRYAAEPGYQRRPVYRWRGRNMAPEGSGTSERVADCRRSPGPDDSRADDSSAGDPWVAAVRAITCSVQERRVEAQRGRS